MNHRLNYLLLTMLLLTAFQVAGQYSIDKVCVGTERFYRVTGEINSSYTWQITDPAGSVIPQLSDRDTIGITWNMAPGLYQLSVIQHSQNSCDAARQLGTIEVFAPPYAFAGNDTTLCARSPLALSGSTAGNYSTLSWTHSGDGNFDNSSLLYPVYTPGMNDILSGHVVLNLTATGLGNPGTCPTAVSVLNLYLNNLIITANSSPASCYGLQNGLVTLFASGGTEPYNFFLNGQPSSSGIYTNIGAGDYYYSVSDALNCGTTGDISVGTASALSALVTPNPANCFGQAYGSLLLSGMAGGSGSYEFSIDNVNWQTSPLFTGLAAGSYLVSIRDANVISCEVNLGSFGISQPAVLHATAMHTNVSVQGANDGTITVTNQSGGSGAYEYSLNGLNWQSSALFSGLSAGTYPVWMRDSGSQDCYIIIGETIIAEGLSVSLSVVNVSCYGSGNGQATATASGGNPPYTYLWNDLSAQTGMTAINLVAGIYTVVVTDSLGNSASVSDTVTQPDEVIPSFDQIGPLCQNSIAPALAGVSMNLVSGTWNPPIINTTTAGTAMYIFTPDSNQCASTAKMIIEVISEAIPVFESIGPLCQNSPAPALPDTSLNSIPGTWNPAVINTTVAGTSVYYFTPSAAQCTSLVSMEILVNEEVLPLLSGIGPLCLNSVPPSLPDTSLNGIHGTWNPPIINTSVTGTISCTFIPDSSFCARTVTLQIEITNSIVPQFTALGPICQNTVAPVLPSTSLNGISGSWSPAVILTTTIGTAVYTFTPGEDQCAGTTTTAVEITNEIAPLFAVINQLCQNSAPPVLPGTSLNGITGAWTPAVINTFFLGTAIYTFTPDTGQCATPVTLAVMVTNQLQPVLEPIGPLCLNSIPPVLPNTSVNGITGNWNPPTINTSVLGSSVYTFVPDTGQCATSVNLAIQVTDQLVPVFAPMGPYCQNSIPQTLPLTSLNGISGNWSPAVISTLIPGVTIYQFMPAPGQCASSQSIAVQVTGLTVPVFAAIAPLCQNSTAPALPGNSINGISGIWSPAAINTSVTGTSVYTFSPYAGQCASSASLVIEVNSLLTPVFAPFGTLCLNSSAPVLPDTSMNGILGQWNPEVINTSVTGTMNYIFTPAGGQCASVISISIEVSSQIQPLFETIGPLCQNSVPAVLSTTSLNGISGIWTPSAINTNLTGITAYTFTPDPGRCTGIFVMNIEISNQIATLFAPLGPFCRKSIPVSLPGISVNGISGTWNPEVINTSSTGSYTYAFTPYAGQCAVPVNNTVVISEEINPQFASIGPLCLNTLPPELPSVSLNGIRGAWYPAVVITSANGTSPYTFTPDTGQCASQSALSIQVSSPFITLVHTYTSTNGQANGSAEIVAEGEAQPLQYSINGIDWQSDDNFSALLAGGYTAWVKDANGCMNSKPFMIQNTVTGDVGVLAGDVQSCISVPIEIPVLAYDFTNIASFTIQLSFDSSVVSFANLTQINEALKNNSLTTTLISPGILQIHFVANDSITLFSEDMLFILNFYGLTSGHTELKWDWLQCVIYSASGYEVPAIYTKGAIQIRPAPLVYTEGSGNYCEGTPLTLSVGSLTGQKLRYKWTSPDGTKQLGPDWNLGKLTVSATGEYNVMAFDSTACANTEKLHVKVYPNPVIALADHDTLCSEQEVVLNPGPGFADYLWQDGSKQPQLLANSEGMYWVIVTDDNGCMGGDSVLLRPCELLIWVPNAFSPNNDGLNDEFLAKSNADMKITFQMLVFNKWGEQIFSSNDISKGWDGTYKGQPCQQDLYTWMILFTAPRTYNFLQKSPMRGNVMLLR